MSALLIVSAVCVVGWVAYALVAGAADLRRRGPIRLDPATVDRLRDQADGRRRTDRGWDEAKP